MATCPHCGESVPDGATACGHCGAALTPPRSEPLESVQPEQSEPQPGSVQQHADPAQQPGPAQPHPDPVQQQPHPGPAQSPPPSYQPPPVYAPPPVGAPAPIPLFRPVLVGRSDILAALRDALVPLILVLLVVFGVVVGLAWLASPTGHGGFHDWFTSSVILVAGALGAPATLTVGGNSANAPNLGGLLNLDIDLSLTISLTVWTVTFLLFFIWMRRGRRSEVGSPSASPLQLVARSALPALGVSLALLVLALVSNTSDVFNLVGSLTGRGGVGGVTQVPGDNVPFGGNGATGSGDSGAALNLATASDSASAAHSSVGVSPGWVFLGPLLIAFAAFLVGRLTAVARRPVGDPGGEWVRKLIAPWRGAARIAWTQLRAVGLLAGIVVLVYAEYQLLTADGSTGREKTAQAIAAALLLPNLMVGGALTGFCVTLSTGALLGLAGAHADKIGLFGNSRPWLIYLLILAAVIGSLLPWFLVRTRRRVVNPAAFAPIQVWRAAVLGAIAGLVATALGEAAISGSSGLGSLGVTTQVGLGYSVIGAVIAGAIWCAAAYLAIAFLVTPRGPRQVSAPPQPGGSSFVHSWPGAQPVPVPEPGPERETAAPTAPSAPAAEAPAAD